MSVVDMNLPSLAQIPVVMVSRTTTQIIMTMSVVLTFNFQNFATGGRPTEYHAPQNIHLHFRISPHSTKTFCILLTLQCVEKTSNAPFLTNLNWTDNACDLLQLNFYHKIEVTQF